MQKIKQIGSGCLDYLVSAAGYVAYLLVCLIMYVCYAGHLICKYIRKLCFFIRPVRSQAVKIKVQLSQQLDEMFEGLPGHVGRIIDLSHSVAVKFEEPNVPVFIWKLSCGDELRYVREHINGLLSEAVAIAHEELEICQAICFLDDELLEIFYVVEGNKFDLNPNGYTAEESLIAHKALEQIRQDVKWHAAYK